jgi:V8-like Glu-specific endopeptidase
LVINDLNGNGILDDPDLVEFGLCTASFVGPRVLLTAAHCTYSHERGGWPDWFVLWPGTNGPDHVPYGFVHAERWYSTTGWIEQQDFLYDFGFVVLPDSEDVGYDTGWFEIGVLTDASLTPPDLWATTIGYPGDKPEGTQWTTAVPTLDEVDTDQFTSQLDQLGGQSGSPIFRQSDEAIFGVISHGTESAQGNFNVSRRMTQDVIGMGNAICEQEGCEIDYFIEQDELTPTPTVTPPAAPTPTPPPTQTPQPTPTPGERPTGPAQPIAGCEYFDATGHNLCEPFLSYWRNNGGLGPVCKVRSIP